MNAGEKRLLIIFCVALGCFVGYYIVTGVFINPAKKAKEDFAKYKNEKNEIEKLRTSEADYATTWRNYAERTFSYDKNQAYDWFGEALKETAAANGFTAPDIKKKSSTKKLGRKTGIEAIYYEVTVKDEFTKALKLLRAMYDSEYVSRVTDVAVTPEPREGRNIVKLSFNVATLVLPRVSPKDTRFFADIDPMPREPEKPLDKWRKDFPPADAFALFESRNIFREYMPPPPNSVLIESLDTKLVGINAEFYWEGKVQTETQTAVRPGQQENIVGKGDEVEIRGAYADGTTFKQRHAFRDNKPWSYKVPKRTPDEPPKTINLAVDSRDTEETRFTIKITTEDGKQKTLPEMVIAPESKISLGEFEAKTIIVSATYPQSDRTVRPKTFSPSPNEQVFLIPKHPDKPEEVDVDDTPKVVVKEDPAPASGYTVTGMLTYRDPRDDLDKQELIVNGPDGREIFLAGNPDDRIDGGVLVAVCPLGGIVHMPETGNYYLYPRGEGFEQRARLNAERPEQLAMAIQEWSQQN